jgi:hypothetical protein
MEPNHQLFSHFLCYRMEMQQGTAERHNENTSGRAVVWYLRAAIGKLLAEAATAWIERSGWKKMGKKTS